MAHTLKRYTHPLCGKHCNVRQSSGVEDHSAQANTISDMLSVDAKCRLSMLSIIHHKVVGFMEAIRPVVVYRKVAAQAIVPFQAIGTDWVAIACRLLRLCSL